MNEANGDGVRPKLPDGWEWKTLGDLGQYHNGRGFKKDEWRDSGRPIIRIQNLTNPAKGFNCFEGEAADRHVVRHGDLLMSWAATLDVFRWDGCEAVLNQHIFKVESDIDSAFHFWVLKGALQQLRAQAHGTGMVHVTRGKFLATPVMLPPEHEQRQLVASLEQALSAIDVGAEALLATSQKLNQLAAAVLETQVWRNAQPSEEAAVTERLVVERRAAFEDEVSTGTRRGAYKPPFSAAEIDRRTAGRLTLSLDEVSMFVTDGDHNPPKRQSTGVPHLTAKHVRDFSLDFADTTFLSPEDFERTAKRYRPLAGDVVVTCVGTIGRVAVVPADVEFSADRNLAVARPLPSISPSYLMYVLATPSMQQRMSTASGSTAQPHLYLGDLKRLPIPVPDRSAQEATVERIEGALAHIGLLHAELNHQRARVAKLKAVCLRDALNGQKLREHAT